ncbi:reverse transcriptase domain-containing protein [Tanacetum coccineum]
MPFGLRNAGATYQRLVDKAFHKQIGRNLEVYVDDLVIKSRTEDEIIRDIEETFKTLRETNMKLNPKNVPSGKTSHAYRTGRKRRAHCLSSSSKRSCKCSPMRSRSKLHINGKIGFSTGARQQTSEKILLSTPNYSGHGPTHKASIVKTRGGRKATKIEYRVGRVFHTRQILADFIVERPEEDNPDTAMDVEEELPKPWTLFTDGLSCADGSRAGLILTNPEGAEFTYALRFRFEETNNEAEYEALIAALRIAEEMGVKNLQANVDSRLVANQVNRTYIAQEADMIRYLKKSSTSFTHLSKQVLVEELKEKSINELEVLGVVEKEGNTWMTPIYAYLTEETLPAEVHKPIPRNLQQKLTPITSPWPFYKWGIDIARPFPEGPGEIISDNGKQFQDNPFKDWCEKLCIRQCFASIKHPQVNGLVERANRSLGEGIKARLEARSKNWMEEISHVLWAHRTMIKSSNGDTPFSLTYGTEVVIPTEIGMLTLRTTEVDMVQNNEALGINLDLLKEKREQAAIRKVKSKAKMEKYYNSKVRSTSFKLGDLGYRSNDASRKEEVGKLCSRWEGPYKITEALGKGAYKLRDHDGK